MATLEDVARLSGVTKSTVSNVISGKAAVREKTRSRVMAAIDELDYHPNLAARGLKKGKTLLFAVLVPTLQNPFYAKVMDVITQAALDHSYHVILCTTNRDLRLAHQHLQELSSRSIDGLIVMSIGTEFAQMLNSIPKDLPVVIGDWQGETYNVPHLPVIDIDFHTAGLIAANTLLDLGHRRIGVILEQPAHLKRLGGFLSGMTQRHITIPPGLIRAADPTLHSGYTQALELLQNEQRPTAIFATNDLMAIGVLEAATQLGINVPQNLSIIGIDDIEETSYTRIPLTTIALPKVAYGMTLVEHLLHTIEHPERQDANTILMRPRLITRASTGPNL